MSAPITDADLARAAIRYVKASVARAKFDQSTKWHKLNRHEAESATETLGELGEELVSARTELYGLVGRYEWQEAQP